jgi:hypothetical protein
MAIVLTKGSHSGSAPRAVLDSACLVKDPRLDTVEMENMTTRLDACDSFQSFHADGTLGFWNRLDF